MNKSHLNPIMARRYERFFYMSNLNQKFLKKIHHSKNNISIVQHIIHLYTVNINNF